LKSTPDYKGAVSLRPSTAADLGYVTALERHPDTRELIGQWSDAEHLDAIARRFAREHWVIEREGTRAGYLIAFDARAEGAGIYVKRILVADKEKGTGKAALTAFLDGAFARPGVDFVWLQVRERNARAQAVYTGLGFGPFVPPPGDEPRWQRVDTSGVGVWRMGIRASDWRSRAR
jgi:ribosomal protein S18 acetylase RimI-like enzyme